MAKGQKTVAKRAAKRAADPRTPFRATIRAGALLRSAGGNHRLHGGERVHVVREHAGTGMVKVERSGLHGFLDRDSYEAEAAGSESADSPGTTTRPTPPFNALTNPPVAHLHTSGGVIDLDPDTHIHVSAEENGHGLVSVLGRAAAGFMDMTEYRPE